jgi:hypothetical protein
MGLTPASGLPRPRARASGRLSCRKWYATVRAAAGESAGDNDSDSNSDSDSVVAPGGGGGVGLFWCYEKPNTRNSVYSTNLELHFLRGNRRQQVAAVTIQIWVSGAGGPASVGCRINGVHFPFAAAAYHWTMKKVRLHSTLRLAHNPQSHHALKLQPLSIHMEPPETKRTM